MPHSRLATAFPVVVLLGFSLPAAAQFAPAPNPPFPLQLTNRLPVALATADFDGDGVADLAIATQSLAGISVFLGDGMGGFVKSVDIALGGTPSALAAADFDGDGLPDLAFADAAGSTVSILFGNGKGAFTDPKNAKPTATGTTPVFLAVGDLNRDGLPDLIAVNRDGGNITILLNNKGSLTGKNIDVGFSTAPAKNRQPGSAAVGDFNGDGILDISVTAQADNSITILLGAGDGTFTPAAGSPFSTGSSTAPWAIVAADFNGDTYTDLAVANFTAGTVTILLGNGTGRFTPAPGAALTSGKNPVAMLTADFNGDGSPDLAVLNNTGGGVGNVAVLLGSLTGAFKAAANSPYTTGTNPMAIAAIDFNGDGLLDLAVANTTDENITILQSGFTTTPVMTSSASFAPNAPAAPFSLVTIFGTGLAPAKATAPSGAVLPTCLGGVAVALTDFSGAIIPLNLAYVSPTQINAMIPGVAAASTTAASFTVAPSTQCSANTEKIPAPTLPQKGAVTIAAVAPALFSANGMGRGPAAGFFLPALVGGAPIAISACGPPPAASCTPDPSGSSLLVLYGTGIRNRVNASDVAVKVGAATVPAFFAGPVPGAPGVDQVEVALPASLAHSGTVFITVTLNGTTSNPVTIYLP